MAVALYPGSFDPVTNGHVDIIERASRLYDRVVVAVLINAEKKPLFSPEERASMLREVTASCQNVEVETFDGLLVDFAGAHDSKVILRGIRAVTDLEYEFQMAGMNARLNESVETLFLMASESHQFISSRFVKEIAGFGGDVRSFVPASVAEQIKLAYANKNG